MNELKDDYMETSVGTKNTYADQIREIAFNTFETTCYMFPLEEWELDEADDFEKPDGSIRAAVDFDGAADGVMVISTSSHLLEAIAANMLGIEEASDEEKEGALCEIANIICGNTVPVFAKNDEICFIRPPRIAGPEEDFEVDKTERSSESVEIILDEGIANISIYYHTEGVQ